MHGMDWMDGCSGYGPNLAVYSNGWTVCRGLELELNDGFWQKSQPGRRMGKERLDKEQRTNNPDKQSKQQRMMES